MSLQIQILFSGVAIQYVNIVDSSLPGLFESCC